ncbi:MAG: peroxidase [Deltaproteobacteria bacterium]|nr:peroxidase [Deltaproteobacteria bacterium]
MSVIDYSDVQGLVRFGYPRMIEACFFLLRVESPAAARSWLKDVSITTAEKLAEPPKTALHVAFTCQGLRALGVPEDMIKGFSPEFISGMAGEESRSRRLGDVKANSPARWQWGGPGNEPHVLVMLYAEPGRLEGWKQTVKGPFWDAAFQVLHCLPISNLDGVEPFGFVDGISQPEIDWNRERQLDGSDELEYGNLVALGEFLLGYPNEYGKYTDRPVVDPKDDPENKLRPAEDQNDKRDVGLNGTYLVLRQLRQDVPGFWQFLDKQANSDPEERRRLAEAMVGRTMDGKPLVATTSRPIAGTGPDDIELNGFTYESDSAGIRCPFGAHIRRANPRNADLPLGVTGFFSRLIRILGFGRKSIRDDMIASTRFHRILRRGREYGPGLSPEDALRARETEGEERGLHFVCLNANIGRQFEFVQNAWMMGTKFDGLTEESDPLLGNREPVPGCVSADTFSIPQQNGLRRCIGGVPQFVTVRGGAYFFLPGIRALRYLASLGG